ncbi:tRNA (adenine(22)-N(1))-methyltransferase [Mycoplasma sp. P36-A1]|uniref:tRNA (adenine(22)-N(1))-methyltransferase n=1 Tax=Mycoplasma sp. P36-A1 TaxID=3252900 RepID=UPI003C301660
MKLGYRLEAIASMIDNHNSIVADIGCDHGWLAIYLITNNKAKKAYACDVNIGPLNNVKTNVTNNYLDDKIQVLLSNGLEKIDENEVSDIVIAGMGGSLIVDILQKDIAKIKDKTLYLQPNINSYKLRTFLINNEFSIVDEKTVKENKIIYQVIKAKPSKENNNDIYSELDLLFGKINLEKNEPLTQELLRDTYDKYANIVKDMPDDNPRKEQFINRMQLIKQFLLSK